MPNCHLGFEFFKTYIRLIFERFDCLYYATAQNLCQPGLEVYLIIKTTLVNLLKNEMK